MGNMQDYFGPPSEAFLKAAPQAGHAAANLSASAEPVPSGANTATGETPFKLVPAEQSGWKLVFHDRFDRADCAEEC